MRGKCRVLWVVVTTISTAVYAPGYVMADHGAPEVSASKTLEKLAEEGTALTIRDIQLDSAGILNGQLVNRHNAPFASHEIELIREDRVVATANTDKDGKFAIKGINGGSYVLAARGGKTPVRLWKAGTAPPSATRGVLLVALDRAVSGNFGPRGGSSSLFRPAEGAALLAIPAVIAGAAVLQKDRQDDNELPPAS